MRWLRLAVPAIVLAAWLAASFAQQGAPPAGTPPPASTPPAGTPPRIGRRRPRRPPRRPRRKQPNRRRRRKTSDVFIPTEELQPDAAITFPVDI